MKTNHQRCGILAMLIVAVAILPGLGCAYVSPSMDEWPADMFNHPVDGPAWVTVPTWTGSVAGSAAGAALIPVSFLSALFIDHVTPGVYAEESEQGLMTFSDGYDVINAPILFFGYSIGTVVGTPFYLTWLPVDMVCNAIQGKKYKGSKRLSRWREGGQEKKPRRRPAMKSDPRSGPNQPFPSH
ncbi:MAG: hypothetical protein QF752_13320 [Planctomycetota bacterium]|jgi:hypothetical protein|nr:hypothetical protein [Planctomycetota bacterium]